VAPKTTFFAVVVKSAFALSVISVPALISNTVLAPKVKVVL